MPIPRLLRGLMHGLWVVVLAWATGAWAAQESLHQGPILEIQVQRGDQVLPAYQVNRLRAGDVFKVRVSAWPQVRQILMIALLQPAGQRVESHSFEVDKEPVVGQVVVQSDDQVPVLVLAPQLRNLFGLYTSFSESENYLNEIIRSDPQRFVALQTTDLINRAIATMTQWLDIQVRGRSGEEAVAQARAMAEKFGVRDINPDCFKGGVMRTQCVAIEMVTSKDFFMPAAGVLEEVSGQGGTQDLSGFLVSNLRVISQARDYLSNRFRDQYEFAPSFARPVNEAGSVQLLSPVRNRMGSTKTAYVYVPGWFSGPMPQLMADDGFAGCLLSGRARVMLEGRLPLAPYWHSFQLTLSDPGTGDVLAHLERVGFNPTRDEVVFEPPRLPPESWPRSNQVLVQLSGLFGFEPIKSTSFLMDLPTRELKPEHLGGLTGLTSGGVSEVVLQPPARSACLTSATLILPDGRRVQPPPQQPGRFVMDLSDVPAGQARFNLSQVGLPDLGLDLEVQTARASITFSPGPNPLLVIPSPKARQWALDLADALMTDDSQFSVRLRAVPPLLITRQAYRLQWRVATTEGAAQQAQTVELIADPRQQELRTREPVRLTGYPWPGMINPIEYRVIDAQSKPLSPWQALTKTVITLPTLKGWQCNPDGQGWLMSGERLDLIRNAGWAPPADPMAQEPLAPARFVPCVDGLCLALDKPQEGQRLSIQLHWLTERQFQVLGLSPPDCP